MMTFYLVTVYDDLGEPMTGRFRCSLEAALRDVIRWTRRGYAVSVPRALG